ncbi:hypothetical protein [Leptolyngbya ohadii]|uniref:hypothetical protein n=1 Tax=Leptolyngbya ohadii TaxID=1962290 RepID=UPI000B59FFB7|nr:hypothetical protein [Leptolyngbya ohadii]
MSDQEPQFSALTPVLRRLLSVQQAIDRKQEEEVEHRLQLLTGYLADTLKDIKLQENTWLEARHLVTGEIRSLLEEDARCVLFLLQFRQFVQENIENPLVATVSDSSLGSNTANWLLLSLPFPLKLVNFRDSQADNAYCYSLELKLDGRLQILQVPAAPPQAQAKDGWDILYQLGSVTKQQETAPLEFPQLEPPQQAVLRREIGCLVCFVAQVLHTSLLVNSFTFP